MERHNCGGILKSAKITVEKNGVNVTVDGLRCIKCSEEVIERDIALALE